MGGGGHATVVLKSLYAREQTCQCTQVYAWPMLVADAGKKSLESDHVHPSKHECARRDKNSFL